MRVNRRTLVLLGALIVIAIAWWTSGGGAAPTAVPAPRNAPAAAAQQAGGPAGETPIDVRIEALSAERQSPAGTGRNPFEFRARPAPPPPPPSSAALSGPVTPPPPAGPPPPPPIALKFIGLVEKSDGMRVAVLSDGHSPVYGQQGQEILGRYRIVSIGVESLELEHLDGRGRQTIRLTGQ